MKIIIGTLLLISSRFALASAGQMTIPQNYSCDTDFRQTMSVVDGYAASPDSKEFFLSGQSQKKGFVSMYDETRTVVNNIPLNSDSSEITVRFERSMRYNLKITKLEDGLKMDIYDTVLRRNVESTEAHIRLPFSTLYSAKMTIKDLSKENSLEIVCKAVDKVTE